MRKRVFILIAALLLVALALTGCAASARDQYAAVLEKYSAFTATDMDIDLTMELSDGTESHTVKNTGNAKSDLTDKANPKIYSDLLMSIDTDESMQTVTTYIDGMMYMDILGYKLKAELAPEKMWKLVGDVTAQLSTADAIADIKVEKDGDSRVFTYTLDPEKAAYAANGVADKIEGSLERFIGDAEYKITSASGTMTVSKDDEIQSMTSDVVMEVTVDGQTINADTTASYVFNAFGDAVVIKAPSGAGEYMEVDSSIFDELAA